MHELLSTTPEMLWLFGGLVGLLAVASTIGTVLSRRAGTPGSAEVRANLVARINGG
jgi:hypothetical protein